MARELGSQQQMDDLTLNNTVEDESAENDQQEADPVDTLVGSAEKNDKGVYVLSEEALKDLDPLLVRAAKAELRARNNQSAYTNAQKDLAKVNSMNKKLVGKLTDNLTVKLSSEDQAKLNAVKGKPEEYHALRLQLEDAAKSALETQLNEIESEASEHSELETRQMQLDAFNESSDIKITQDVIDNDIPPSYTKKLANKEISFTEFLTNCQSFLTKNKVIAGSGDGDEDDNPVDLDKLSGSSSPSKRSTGKSIVEDYSKTIY